MATVINPSIDRITGLYENTIEELLEYLTEELSADLFSVADYKKQAEVITRIEQMIAELKMHMEVEVSQEISEVFNQSKHEFFKRMKKQGITIPEVNGGSLFLDEQVIKQLASDTMSDLASATDMTEMHIKRIIREVFSERIALDKAIMLGQEQITADITRRLAELGLSKTVISEGFIGIIDKAGKQWNLNTYVDMVVRTKLMDADIEASRTGGLQTGVDLAVISQHGAKDDCAKWENCIVSMNGMTEGFPSYAEVKATNECFHPNCQHHLQPVRDVSLIHPEILKKNKHKMQGNWQTLRQS